LASYAHYLQKLLLILSILGTCHCQNISDICRVVVFREAYFGHKQKYNPCKYKGLPTQLPGKSIESVCNQTGHNIRKLWWDICIDTDLLFLAKIFDRINWTITIINQPKLLTLSQPTIQYSMLLLILIVQVLAYKAKESHNNYKYAEVCHYTAAGTGGFGR